MANPLGAGLVGHTPRPLRLLRRSTQLSVPAPLAVACRATRGGSCRRYRQPAAPRAAIGVLWDKLCAMSDDRAVKALERRMNRPLTIALGALVVTIGVFFAGFTLIAGSPSPKVTFPPELAVITPNTGKTRVLPVSVDQGTSGTTATDTVRAALKAVRRGGEATVAPATPRGDVGQVGLKRTSSSSQTRSRTAVKAKPKTVKRAALIGANSGPNGDSGLAGDAPPSGTTSP